MPRIWSIFRTKTFKERRFEELRKQKMSEEQETSSEATTVDDDPDVGEDAAEVIISSEEDSIEEVWHVNGEDPADDGLTVCNYDSGSFVIDITMHDYKILARNEWLNDVIVYFGLQRLKKKYLLQSAVHIFSYSFYPAFYRDVTPEQMDRPPSDDLAKMMHGHVARHARHLDLFDKDLVIVPVKSDSHWFVVVFLKINENKSVLFTLNSCGSLGEYQILSHFKAFLLIQFKETKDADMLPPDIEILSTDPPQQEDGSSCGLFVLQYVETLFRRYCSFPTDKNVQCNTPFFF